MLRVGSEVMKTVPPVTIVEVSDADLERRVRKWKQQHPGFDETNYVDAFRDAEGELIESDEFFEADDLFALYLLNRR